MQPTVTNMIHQIIISLTTPLTLSTTEYSLSAMAMIFGLAWTTGSSRTPGTPPGVIKGISRSKCLLIEDVIIVMVIVSVVSNSQSPIPYLTEMGLISY